MSESIELTIYPSENNLQNMKYKIGKKESILGKNKNKCDVPLIFSDISDVHAKFTIKGSDDYIIRDLNSENGVFLIDPKTGTKQRINPGKDYEVRPEIPFYVSQYKCVFLRDENSKSNENSSTQKPLIKKQMPVYAKKFKPKNSSQSDSKEEIDDETAFQNKIQEENQKRLKELKEIEEKTGEENETEEKKDPENPSTKNNSIDEENQAIADFELKKNIDKNFRVNQLKRVTSIKSDSGDEELDPEKKKILLPDEIKNEKKFNYEQESNPSESQKLVKKKTKDDIQKKVQFIEPEKKETKQIIKDEAFEQKKKKFVMEEAKSMERQTKIQIEEQSENNMNEVLEKNKTNTNVIKKTIIHENKKPENSIKDTKTLENKQSDNKPKQETNVEKNKKKSLSKKKLVVQEVIEEKEEEEDKPEEIQEDDIFDKYQHKAQNKIQKKETGKNPKEENEKPEVKIPEKTESVQTSTATIKIKKPPPLKPKNAKQKEEKAEEATKQEKKVIPKQTSKTKNEETVKSTSTKAQKNSPKKKPKKKQKYEENEESNDDEDETSPEISEPEPQTIGKPKPKPRKSNTSHPKPKLIQIGVSGFILGDGDIMILKDLGLKVIENKEYPIKYLILQSFKRTIRMMMALNRGIEIIDKKWLDDCIETKEIPDPMNYIFRDKDSEKKFGFKFEESLSRARENYQGVFYGFSFWVSRNVIPSYEELKLLILSGRGNILNKKPLPSEEKTLIIMSKEENEKVEKLKEDGFYVYSTEFIFSACLKQKMEFENNLI